MKATICKISIGVVLLCSSCVTTEPVELPRTLDVANSEQVQTAIATRTEMLGVRVEYNESDSLEKLEELAGVRVAEVAFGSPAARSGIRTGDVIVRVDEVEIDAPDALESALSLVTGGSVRIMLERGTLVIEATSVLPPTREQCRVHHHRDPVKTRAGFETVTSATASDRLLAEVVEVLPKSPFQRAGIRVGDQIVRVDEQEIHSAEQLVRLLTEGYEYGQRVEFRIRRGYEVFDRELRLWAPRRVISESSVPLVWNYERDLKKDRSRLRMLGIFGVYLFSYERSGNERAYGFLWWTPVRTGYGELVEEGAGA